MGKAPSRVDAPRTIILRKQAPLRPLIQGPKVLAPWGAAQTHLPTRPRSLLGQPVPPLLFYGPGGLSSENDEATSNGPFSMRQVPPRKLQTGQIKEKHRVTFK